MQNVSRRSFIKGTAVTGAAAAAITANFGSGLQAAVDSQSRASSPSKLKITKISTAYLFGDHMFVKIETNQGITGYGESVDAVAGTHYLAKSMASQLIGKNPLDVHRLFEDIRQEGVFAGAQAGVYVSVLSGIEIALWDVAGKALELPVYRLLGGKFRDKIHMYTHPDDDTPAGCLEVKNAGFDALKVSIDWSEDPNKDDVYNGTANNKEMERMVNLIADIREAVGPYMDIMVEMHTRFDLPTGIRIVKQLEPYNPFWIEEPVPAENMDTLREITLSSNIPICVGENLFLAHQFRRLLDKKAADIIMPDVQKCGGIGEAQRIANLANLYYVPFGPHMVSSPLGMMASAHVCASVPNFLRLECHWKGGKYRAGDIVKEMPTIENSYLTLSEKPGIGIELDEDIMRKYAAEGVPFFE
jgi:galactonate dehydratase